MEIKAHFNNIRQIIIDNLKEAKKEIKIAVAWFTNKEIFDIVVTKASKIPVHLIIINDDINNRFDGLDFQKFIVNGGIFYFANQESPMHNKYCVIDHNILITGSYNYTYLAESTNEENIVVFKGCSEIIEKYLFDFDRLISNFDPIKNIKNYLRLYPYQKGTFYYKNYSIRDINAYINILKKRDQYKVYSLIKELESTFLNIPSDAFQINDVVYRQWCQDYYTDKILVFNNDLVLFYRTIIDSSCWVYGPKTNQAWTLRDCSRFRNTRKSYKITNICIDGEEVVKISENEEIFFFTKNGKNDSSENHGYKINEKNKLVKKNGDILPIKKIKLANKKSILSCEVHFNIENFPLNSVDLIEGIGCENLENRWHCFDINLKLNREKL